MDGLDKIPGREITYEQYAAYKMRNTGGGGGELHIEANAASDPAGNEADATTGWSHSNLALGANVFESQSSVVHTGSYAFHGNSNDTPTNGSRYYKSFTTEVGKTYRLTCNVRHVGTGGNWRVWNGATAQTIVTAQTSFIAVSLDFTAIATTTTVSFQEYSATNDGGLYADNISFKAT